MELQQQRLTYKKIAGLQVAVSEFQERQGELFSDEFLQPNGEPHLENMPTTGWRGMFRWGNMATWVRQGFHSVDPPGVHFFGYYNWAVLSDEHMSSGYRIFFLRKMMSQWITRWVLSTNQISALYRSLSPQHAPKTNQPLIFVKDLILEDGNDESEVQEGPGIISKSLVATRKSSSQTRNFWVDNSGRIAADITQRVKVSKGIPRKNWFVCSRVVNHTVDSWNPAPLDSLSDYLQGFIHPRWCRISSIKSSEVARLFRWRMYHNGFVFVGPTTYKLRGWHNSFTSHQQDNRWSDFSSFEIFGFATLRCKFKHILPNGGLFNYNNDLATRSNEPTAGHPSCLVSYNNTQTLGLELFFCVAKWAMKNPG